MDNSNIEKFDETTGKIFAKLYAAFPVPVSVHVTEFGVNQDELADYPSPAFKEAEFLLATLQWLADTGYIAFSEKRPPFAVHDAVLTAAGLQVLKATPKSLRSDKTLGEQLVDGAKEGARDVLLEGAKVALATGAAFIRNAIIG